MKHFHLFLLPFLCFLSHTIHAESTFEYVQNNIFELHCNSAGCHNSVDASAELVLEGSPEFIREQLYNIPSANSAAMGLNNRIVYPGDPYRSTLFRWLNNGLAGDVKLMDEEDVGGVHEGLELSEIEREMIRQWILFDSPLEGEVVEHALIEQFYEEGGIWAIDPANPPEKPASGEGYQIHIGPIFVSAWEGAEQPDQLNLYKYEDATLPAVEVDKVEAFLGSSHHLNVYRFNGITDNPNDHPFGLRDAFAHGGSSVVSGFQETSVFTLPQGAAMLFEENTVLDFEIHTLNYSTTSIMASDAYFNVYTQPYGTAAQSMEVNLFANVFFSIPNDGEEHFFEREYVNPSLGLRYIWLATSHAHKLSTGFDMWLRNPDGSKGQHIYAGSQFNGVPECEYIGWDYQHPPKREFGPLLPINFENGLIYRASYVNYTDSYVGFGPTVNDEMMVGVVAYVNDTEGVVTPEGSPCFLTGIDPNSLSSPPLTIQAYPNPADQVVHIAIHCNYATEASLQLYDLHGQEVKRVHQISLSSNNEEITIDTHSLNEGLYIVRVLTGDGGVAYEKLVVR